MLKFSNPRQDKYVFIIFLAVSYYMVLLPMFFLGIDLWGATHWLFSMQEGFYSRALLGSIIQAISPDHYGSLAVISFISWSAVLALTTLLVVTGYRYWKIHHNFTGFLVVCVLIASPGSVQYFTRIAGFLDQVGFLILIIVLFILPKLAHKSQWLLVGVTAFLLTLVHEGFLLLIAPVLPAFVLGSRIYTVKTSRDSLNLVLLSALSLLPAAVLALLLLTIARLNYSPESFSETMQSLQAKADFTVRELALMTQFRSISENVHYLQYRLFNLNRIISVALAFVALLPSCIAAFSVMSHSLRNTIRTQKVNPLAYRIMKTAAILFCLAPLLLAFIGHDYPRWVAAAMINLFVAGMMLEIYHSTGNEDNQKNVTPLPFSNYFLLIAATFSLIVGPVTNMHAPDLLLRLVPAIAEVLTNLF